VAQQDVTELNKFAGEVKYGEKEGSAKRGA
jgi:hypothetical protein